jgi:hypothetical protein
MIYDFIADREIGDVNAVQDTLEVVTYIWWAMKEPDYIMKILATGGSIIAKNHAGPPVIVGLMQV